MILVPGGLEVARKAHETMMCINKKNAKWAFSLCVLLLQTIKIRESV